MVVQFFGPSGGQCISNQPSGVSRQGRGLTGCTGWGGLFVIFTPIPSASSGQALIPAFAGTGSSPVEGSQGYVKFSLPLRWGRARVGVKRAEPHHRHPHPNLPPSRGKEFMLWIFSRSCYIQPKLYLKYPNTYPSQPIEGDGTDALSLTLS